jgi:hypothetical protein
VTKIGVHELGKKYFELVVRPAVDELLAEYNGTEGYEAGVHEHEILTAGISSVAEVHGVYVVKPDGRTMYVSICWPEGSEEVLIGQPGGDAEIKTLSFHKTDKERLKNEIIQVLESA